MRWLILVAMTACGPMPTVQRIEKAQASIACRCSECDTCGLRDCSRCPTDAGQEDGPWL
jgi:hypothetical protein